MTRLISPVYETLSRDSFLLCKLNFAKAKARMIHRNGETSKLEGVVDVFLCPIGLGVAPLHDTATNGICLIISSGVSGGKGRCNG
jgi:hypothetical protein